MSTSITTITSDHTKPYNKNSLHRRNNSGELDVFEAAQYFKEDQDTPNYINSSNITQNLISIREFDHHQRSQRPGRMSLDMPKRSPSNLFISPRDLYKSIDHNQKQDAKDHSKKSYKQTSSPGAKLANFLNTLFNQTTLKKTKTKKKKNNKDFEEDCQSPSSWRRKRRSSISHFITAKDHTLINAGDSNSKSMKLSSSLSSVSGFKAPQICTNTPTKSYREYMEELFLSDRNRKHVVPLSHSSYGVDSEYTLEKRDKDRACNLGDNSRFRDWIDDRLDLKTGNYIGDDRDGAESDSSSDLFDLPNIHEFDCYSSGLPVYETTQIKNIAAAPVTSITTIL